MDSSRYFRDITATRVIHVMTEATKYGYRRENDDWANLGQGSPETGPIGETPRIEHIDLTSPDHQYSYVSGMTAFREAVANMYNEIYRKDKKSKYTAENVCISSGGRGSISRIATALGEINLGYFSPDYPSYEQILGHMCHANAVPIFHEPGGTYKLSAERLKNQIYSHHLDALIASNPCNPTGQLIAGEELKAWVELAKSQNCLFIMDEFYSQYIYKQEVENFDGMVSSAAYIEDVDQDPILIVDGLTKNWRYPGWRLCWTVGPKDLIKKITDTASFIDGGPSHPLQKAALPTLNVDFVKKNCKEMSEFFKEKLDYSIERLESMGIKIDNVSEGSFYIWANLENLPDPINDSAAFFEEGLKEKVIMVPGRFFDLNPGQKRDLTDSPYKSYCRISFGPEKEILSKGYDALERVIKKFS